MRQRDRAMTGTNDNREQFQKMIKDSDENTKRCLFDAFIKQITINENNNITIYCHSVDPDFVSKNEHLDKVFAYDTLGGDGGN